MSDTSRLSRRERHQRQHRRMSILAFVVAIVVLGTAGTALAYWTASSNGTASAQADTMNVGHQPSGTINGQDVTLTWAASTTSGGHAVGGYTINRYSVASGGTATAATGGCAGTVAALTCTEQTAPAGSWFYAITPHIGTNWVGAEGPRSTVVTVIAPALSFTANQFFNASGGTLAGGTLTHFKNNETVTFHLDSSGGTTVAASVSSVDGTGQAGSPTPFTVTIPGSATEGSHIIVAVGGSGSQATSNTFTVDKTNPITASVSTPVAGSVFRASTVPATFTGSAADNSGGVGLNLNSTTFTLQRPGDSFYWTGTTWVSTATNLATTHAATTSNTAAAWTSNATMPTWASQPDGTYTVTATATDKAGNTLTGTAITFTLDKTNPITASVTTPTTGSTFRGATVPTFAGSAADNSGGVGLNANSTTFTLQRSTDNSFWTGTTWGAATNLATTHSATTSNTAAAWTSNATMPTWTSQPDGTYTVTATATDKAGNTLTGTAITFTLDNTAPITASVASPVAGSALRTATVPATFTGSAADNSGGVGLNANSTTFTLQRPGDNFYWTGSAWQSSVFNLATTHSATTSNTTASWTSNATMPTWSAQTDGLYTVRATATDGVGNTFSGTAITFTLDNASPTTATVTTPTTGSLFRAATVPATFGGSAADNSGGVGLNANSTTFTLQRPGDNFYWTGSAWQSSVFNLATTHSATTSNTTASWTSNATMPTWSAQTDGVYKVQATANDKAGNTLTGTAVTFTLDNTGPTINITFPASGGIYNNAGWNAGCSSGTCGTSSDTNGVSLIEISVQQGSGSCFHWGHAGQFNQSCPNYQSATGTTSWSQAFPALNFNGDGQYTVLIRATDAAGNTSTSSQTFTLDNTAPSGTGLSIPNVGTTGKAEQGDTVTYTYSEPMAPGSILGGWNGSTTQNVVVRINNNTVGGVNDEVQVWNATNTTQLPLGSINLARSDYVTASVTFGASGTASTMTMSGNSITITLGTVSSAGSVTPTAATGKAIWTPSASATDLAGNPASTSTFTQATAVKEF